MATSNNDRISSRRLLDTLRGLQASRHLGSEPEVVTETTQHTYVPDQIPRPIGTPTSEEAYYGAFKPTTEPLTLPIYVYGPYVVPVGVVSFNECEPTILATINYSKEYTVNEKTFMMYGESELPESYDDFGNTWNGFVINGNGDYWECSNTSEPRGRIYYFSDKQPVTEDITTTTKTKHTIKQDYLPNADWNVNDPDADGYVEGRTHWVEQSLTGVIPSAGTYNSLMEFNDALNSVEPSVVYVCDEYNVESFPATMPEYTGEPVAVLDKEFDIQGVRVLGPSDWDGTFDNGMPEYLFIFKQLSTHQNNVLMSLQTQKMYRWKAIVEVAHKLDRKFYDYTEPFDPTGYTKDSDISIKTISHDYESTQGLFTHSYNYVRLPNGLAYGNITLHVDSWDDTTKTGTFSTVGTPLANPGSMVGGTAYVNGGIVFFTVEADGSNPRISNPIPSDLLVVNRADMWIPQMFIRKEDE